eukprot:TRINITY_DN3109_c0_g1_i2.p1 TRINITY_DN3109_c0_g1~~TRINITY_DN3109_c0_g1_i2.p1  ORF type:complete len:489 (+),score=105.54 TRINITY_DN3109_c0_g1_i2:28-1467(+)
MARWASAEFCVYYAVLVAWNIVAFTWGYRQSEALTQQRPPPRWLRDGWLFGRFKDSSDLQWRMVCSYMPLLLLGFPAWAGLCWVWRNVVLGGSNSPKAQTARTLVYVASGLGFIFYLHGVHAAWPVVIAVLNYALARILGGTCVCAPAVWTFNVAMLVTCDLYHGFHNPLAEALLHSVSKYEGMLRWEVSFNLIMLRLISFGMDYHRMLSNQHGNERIAARSEYFRAQETERPASDYNLLLYIAYVFYPPLYIAGPLVSFNAFAAQSNRPQTTHSLGEIFRGFVRVILYFLGVEIVLHFEYVYGITQSDVWKTHRGGELLFGGMFTLNFMYMKFLIIWRLFRMLALLDGVDSPENMTRCVNNNFTFTGFWRSWHGSLNEWIVRYMYLPLGGRKYQVFSIWFIFVFIGIWHDLMWRWVAWALINCLFFTLEIAITSEFRSSKYAHWHAKWYWRHIICVCGSLNVILLVYVAPPLREFTQA